MEEKIIENEFGSKQSDIGEGWDLIDPVAISELGWTNAYADALKLLHACLHGDASPIDVINNLCVGVSLVAHLDHVKATLVYGSKKYAPDNWRAISVRDHLLHAYRHLVLYVLNSNPEGEEDLAHCHCRLHMAIAKQKRPDYFGQFTPKQPTDWPPKPKRNPGDGQPSPVEPLNY